MTPVLTSLAFVVVGAVVGGFMARRLPMNKARAFCAVGAIVAAIGMVARAGSQDPVRLYLGAGIAVIVSSFSSSPSSVGKVRPRLTLPLTITAAGGRYSGSY